MGQDQRNTFMFLSHCFTFPQLVFLLGEGHFSSAFPHLLTDAFPCRNNIWDHRLCLLKWFPSCCLPKRTLTFSEWSCSATQNYKSIKKPSPLTFVYTAAKCTFKEKTLLQCDCLNLLAIRSLTVYASHFRTLDFKLNVVRKYKNTFIYVIY